MSQGMDDKIRQISEMLGSREAQDGIRQLFSSLGQPRQPVSSEAGSPQAGTPSSELSYAETPMQQSPQETDWVYQIQNMLSQVNNVQDSRVNLLRSVHPFLNPSRKERCSTCMNILKIADILRAFSNNGGRFL